MAGRHLPPVAEGESVPGQLALVLASLRDGPGVLRACAVTFIALSLARPVSYSRPDSSDEKGIDIVLVLDLSGSTCRARS